MIKKPARDDPRASAAGDSASGGAAASHQEGPRGDELSRWFGSCRESSGFSKWDCGGRRAFPCSNPSRRSHSSAEAT